jgi:hypothetical protein
VISLKSWKIVFRDGVFIEFSNAIENNFNFIDAKVVYQKGFDKKHFINSAQKINNLTNHFF